MVSSGDDILSKLDGIESELNQLKEKKKLIHLETPNTKSNSMTQNEENPTINKTKKNPPLDPSFDPDKLVLTKKDILDFCDRVMEKWKSDPKKDASHLFAMNAVKTSILWTEEESLKEIWREILNWNFELLFKNAMAQAKEQNLSWAGVMAKLGND